MSATFSAPAQSQDLKKHNRGSFLELSWGSKEPLTLKDGETRSFFEDGDTVALHGLTRGHRYTIGFGFGFGSCTILPALTEPYAR